MNDTVADPTPPPDLPPLRRRRNARWLLLPAWFWAQVEEASPPVFRVVGILGIVFSVLGLGLEIRSLDGLERIFAVAFRGLFAAYFGFFVFASKRYPAFLRTHYDALIIGLLLSVGLVFGLLGSWVPGGFGNFYFAAVLEAELVSFTFLPIPLFKLVPVVLLSNGVFLAAGLYAGNPVDNDFVNLVVTFVFFGAIGCAVQMGALRLRLQAYRHRRVAVENAEELGRRGLWLEGTVLERTRALEQAYLDLKRSSQEKLAAERALREAEVRYRKTIENSASVIFEVRPDNRLRLVRAPQEQLFMLPIESIDPQKIIEGIHEESRIAFFSMLTLCRSDLRNRRMRARVRYEQGPWHWLEWSCSYYEAADGALTGVLLARDVSYELRLQKEVERQSRLAAVGQLAAGITHDFNNALAGVRLGIDAALAAGPRPPDAEQHLRRAAESAQRSRTIIRRVLDFAKHSPTIPRAVNIVDFVEECAAFLRHVLTDNIAVDIRGAQEGWVQIDPTQIEQAVVNLAVNARDAMPQGGKLILESETCETNVFLRIIDTGAGMTEEVMAHLFEPFFTTKGEQGTGLGLAQAYGLVQQNNGRISAESEPGKGTTFVLEFPRLEAPILAEIGEAVQTTDEPVAVPPWRVLLVEDEAALRTLFELMLTTLGVTIVAASSAQNALEILERERGEFDLLVTDQSMPGMAGRDLALAVKERYPHVRVMLITGLLTEPQLLQAEPPFDGVLLKPFDVNDLRAALLELNELQA